MSSQLAKSATQAATPGGEAKCMPMFKNPITNGVMDIRYALGYFDDSQGIDIIYSDFNYGLSPSLDIEVFKVLRGYFTKKCEGTRSYFSERTMLVCKQT